MNTMTDSRLANVGAQMIEQAYMRYLSQFKAITLRAKEQFENRDRQTIQNDAVERLDLYRTVIDETVESFQALLGERLHEKLVWVSIKAVYSGWIADRNDWDLAETFFNSVTRHIFTTVGVDPQIEFVNTDFRVPPTATTHTIYNSYEQAGDFDDLIKSILSDYPFQVGYENLDRDAKLAGQQIQHYLAQRGESPKIRRVEVLKTMFYRGRAVYLIGRLYSAKYQLPLVIALDNVENGIIIDALLLDENLVSILFSFAHSYFRVYSNRPYDLVMFLKSILPRKKVAELYISLGFNKHGKTELFRDVIHHLAKTKHQFQTSRGKKGMVMIVFDMPDYDVVVKIIRDRFAQPKDSTRTQVMEKYRLVFKHDRAGRLIDAQEFEHLRFDRSKFSAELLAELESEAVQTVTITDKHVILKHAYIERKLTPLDIYVDEADLETAKAAVIEYGNAIKDLMATNIFPGDLLLKNFGVTRHGRVVFYDYDELCLLTECRFRPIPRSSNYEDEIAEVPWFSVRENDVFPEQFPSFLGLDGELRDVFCEHHSDLFDYRTWRAVQDKIKAGNIMRIYPYNQDKRLGE